jgi:hypothetical protein
MSLPSLGKDSIPFESGQGLFSQTGCPNFMSRLNHAFEELDVALIPVGLIPFEVLESVFEDRICVGNQEERSPEAVLVEEGDRSLKLAPQSVVEGERNECFFHCSPIHAGYRRQATGMTRRADSLRRELSTPILD